MVTRSKKQTTIEKERKLGRIKVGKLNLNKETVKDLTKREAGKIRGGDDTDVGTQGCTCMKPTVASHMRGG